MANSTSHFVLPYPIYAAKFSVPIPYLDADGDPTDPTTPDTEISKDAGNYTDCTEEVTTITGSNGSGYLTLTATEMTATCVFLAAKVASGPNWSTTMRPCGSSPATMRSSVLLPQPLGPCRKTASPAATCSCAMRSVSASARGQR